MHELSIATSIIEIAEENLSKSGAKTINDISIEIGAVSGIVIEALEFALNETIKNTVLKNAHIDLIHIPGLAHCNDCQAEFEISDMFFNCPECGGFNSSIKQGKELKIKSLNVS